MKKIIAAFDGLKFSESTLQYAINLIQNSDGVLTGVFLDDFTYHSYKVFDMVGSQGVSPERVRELMTRDRETRKLAVQKFEQACGDAGIKPHIHRDESIALQELLRETIYADLLVISASETLTHNKEPLPTRFIRDLLVDVQSPVLVVPENFKEVQNVTLLYDGDPSSVYAAKMFSYMFAGLKKLHTEVVLVKTNGNDNSLPENKLIREFITCHYPNAEYNILRGVPETEIAEYVEAKQNTLIVLGAYRRSMVSRWFKPSMADVLMKTADLPLFIAHYK